MQFRVSKGAGARHASPPLWLPAFMFALLFLASLFFVTGVGGKPSFPGPWEPSSVIAKFFQLRPGAAAICAALQFGAAIPLGVYTATAFSRYDFHGVRAAGAAIALFGGFATAVTMLVAASVLWSLSFPGVADNEALTQALYRITFALGGPGYSVPLGLLIAGVAIPGGLSGLLPKWLFWSGLILGIVGELSWLDLLFPQTLFLVPLTRFPGFLWLLLAGLWLPSRPLIEGPGDGA
jgi:hypothetical protein